MTSILSNFNLSTVDRMFKESVESFSNEPARFYEALNHCIDEHKMTLPSLNAGPIVPGQLVRVRCMVQDVRGPEFFSLGYKVESPSGEEILTGFLRDSFDTDQDVKIDCFGSTSSRQCYTMVSIPGASAWWTDEWNGHNGQEQNDEPEKKPRMEIGALNVQQFIAKVAGDNEFLPNSTWDLFGFLSTHSLDLSDETSPSGTNSSKLPNLHVISYSELKHAPDSVPDRQHATSLKEALTTFLGDETAASYLMMNLVSMSYARPSGMPICCLPLNLCGIQNGEPVVDAIKQLLPKVLHVVLTPELLSSQHFAPVKNYESDELKQGLLQASSGTTLIIDETQLPVGNFPVSGHAEANLSALERLVVAQQMEYDYGYYKIPFDVDMPVIIISKAQSRFIRTPFRVAVPPGIRPQVLGTNEQLTEIRKLIQHSRKALKDLSISEATVKGVQDAFVDLASKLDPKTEDKAETLHQMLLLCRLIACLDGKSEVDMDCWHRAIALEKSRNETMEELGKNLHYLNIVSN